MNSQNNEPESKTFLSDENEKQGAFNDLNDYVYLRPVKKRRSGKTVRGRRRKKMKTYKKVILSIVSAILALVIVFVGTLAYLIYNGSRQLFENTDIIMAPDGVTVQNDGRYVVYNGKNYEFNNKVTSILCMGIDREQLSQDEASGGGQADVIILIAVDTESGKTTLVNISRDTMTDVAVYSAGGGYLETRNEQICLSYAYGDGEKRSCENTVTTVRRLLYNVPINTYMALDLDGISVINDSVGGIDVVSPETVGSFTEGQSYHLEGDTAESFVRARDTEKLESNAGRMQRQQTYLNSFVNTLINQTKQDIMTPVNLFNTASPYACTNLNPSKICYLAQNVLRKGVTSVEMQTVPGEIKQGEKYAEFYVNEDELYPIFLDIFYKPA